jgi:hypothetical protein
MKTYDVELSGGVPFGLFMYGADSAPTLADVRGALKRCGLRDKGNRRHELHRHRS